MKKYNPTVTLFLDQRVQKNNGKFPLKLTIYCKPDKKRFNTDIDLTEDEWKKINSEKLRDDTLKKVAIKMNALKKRATQIIEDLVPFSFMKFEEAFYENSVDLKGMTLSSLFDRYIAIQNKKGNVGTAISYKTTINSLNEFKKNITLFDVTPNFLQSYEDYMLGRNKSQSTVGIYLRQLRAIYNDAIARNLISKDNYPFGKHKYTIPVSSNVKKAISSDDLRLLLNYTPNVKEEQKALDFWILSYLCNGINFCDLLRLKYENIDGDSINFIRSKTKNTKKGSQQMIRVHFHPRAKAIINRWKSDSSDSSYIFPTLRDSLTPIQEKYLIQDFIKINNKYMEIVRTRLGISQKCNTYSCRHTFATHLKNNNVNPAYISESLGHANISTTMAYLASFEDKTKIEYSNLLTDF